MSPLLRESSVSSGELRVDGPVTCRIPGSLTRLVWSEVRQAIPRFWARTSRTAQRGLRIADFDPWIDFKITSTGQGLRLDFLLFDIGRLQNETTTPDTLTLTYLGGDLDDSDDTVINSVSDLRPPPWSGTTQITTTTIGHCRG